MLNLNLPRWLRHQAYHYLLGLLSRRLLFLVAHQKIVLVKRLQS
jgi:hypothetical protein